MRLNKEFPYANTDEIVEKFNEKAIDTSSDLKNKYLNFGNRSFDEFKTDILMSEEADLVRGQIWKALTMHENTSYNDFITYQEIC